MAHLAARASLAFAVDVKVGAFLRDQAAPTVPLVADEIVDRLGASGQAGRAGRKVADDADVLLDLRG
jgi:hypothetical protein